MIQKIEDNRELLLIKLDLGTFFFFKDIRDPTVLLQSAVC